MSKLFKTILAVSAGIIALAGVAFLVIHFWEDLKAICPCCKDKLQDEAFAAEDE